MTDELPGTNANKLGNRRGQKNRRSQSGVTMVETLLAAVLLIVVVIGIVPVLVMGFVTTEQQGNIATRTTEYAQDKMESLLNLSFTDAATNTAVNPSSPIGGTGLGGVMAANSQVGSIPPNPAVAGYVDYIDANGNLLISPTGAFYRRQWSISTDATATLKTINVVVTALPAAGVRGLGPVTVLVCIKSSGL